MWQAVATLGTGLLAAHSARQINKKQIGLSHDQMAFQERMSNTAYQRAMEDMRKAGINPLMVSKLGGASTPTGAMAQLRDPFEKGIQATNSYNQARLNQANADLAKQDFDTLKSRGLSKSILAGNPLNLLINSAMNTLSKTEQKEAIKGILNLFGVSTAEASTGKNEADKSKIQKDLIETIKASMPKKTPKHTYRSRFDHPSQRRYYKPQFDHPSQRGRK